MAFDFLQDKIKEDCKIIKAGFMTVLLLNMFAGSHIRLSFLNCTNFMECKISGFYNHKKILWLSFAIKLDGYWEIGIHKGVLLDTTCDNVSLNIY